MVSVTVSPKLRLLYRKATGQKGMPFGPSVRRVGNAVAASEENQSPDTSFSKAMPLEKNRIMQPGKRAMTFDGASLISADSSVLDDGGYYKLDIFQRADGQFVVRLNKYDAFETVRLLLTATTQTIEKVESLLRGVDGGKFVSFFPAQSDLGQTTSDQDVYVSMKTKLQQARSEYMEFIGSIFSDQAHE